MPSNMNEPKQRRLRDRRSGTATLINEGCKITGFVGGKGDFLISGEIEGDGDISGSITLTNAGFWKGTLRADSIIISGRVDGDIVATGNVEITASARIVGTVTGGAIAVAEGAVVEGIMSTTVQPAPTEFVEKRQADD